jgi:N utilization substance protein A
MKGSRVQAIIKELRGEKIDIIEWSDEPSVFAANALSPAKVSQVRITNIEDRLMEVIVGEDQLSLAIGKKGQNVRLATRLVGWEIKIVSEELLKQEIARQMGRMMAAGEPVPITSLEGVTTAQAEILSEKGIADVESLAAASIDDLVEFLDVSMDEAEQIKTSAASIVEAKESEAEPGSEVSAEGDPEELSPEAAAEIVEAEETAPEAEESSDIISEREFEAEADGSEPATEEKAAGE